MTTGERILRPLDPVERYFWLLGHVDPCNPVVEVECDRLLDPDQLREGLRLLQTRHPLLGARVDHIDGEPVFVTTAHPPELTVMDEGASWVRRAELAFDVPLGSGEQPLLRAEYIPYAGEDRSTLLLIVHHAIADGRSGRRLAQRLMQWVERGDDALPSASPLPPALHEHFPERLKGARAAAEVLAALREERAAVGASDPMTFHDPDAEPRVSHLDRVVLDTAAIGRLRDAARAAGVSSGAMLSAAALRSAAELFDEPADHVLMLASPTDLGSRVDPPVPAEAMRVAVGLLSTPYRVSADDGDDLPARIIEQTRREVARGESHLFYRFARVATYPVTDEGFGSFAAWTRSIPQNVTMSNVGGLDHAADPEWLRSLTISLPPAPNQVVLAGSNIYRDRLTVLVGSDRAKLPERLADRFLDGFARRIGGLRVTAD